MLDVLPIRDLGKQWVSRGGRVAGDAAHPHLPTSISGGTQAIVDGVKAVSVQYRGVTDQVAPSLRVYELLRVSDVSTPWIRADGLDSAYAEERCTEALTWVVGGAPFVSRNGPWENADAGWTVQCMLAHNKDCDSTWYMRDNRPLPEQVKQ
ncbi:hypothetical protein CDD83_5643 [Cordyceps sp. RAO-2017]|nr:hypothetical protein CDD83_5643 [Cordyceps sp. RAO-2017]